MESKKDYFYHLPKKLLANGKAKNEQEVENILMDMREKLIDGASFEDVLSEYNIKKTFGLTLELFILMSA